MESKYNSPSNDFQVKTVNNLSLSNNCRDSIDIGEKNINGNQKGDDKEDFYDFNILFFLPKEKCKNLLEDEDNSDIKNNVNIINNIFFKKNDNDNHFNGNKNLKLSKDNDTPDKYLDLNQNKLPFFQNIPYLNDNNQEIKKEFINNVNNIDGYYFKSLDNESHNYFSIINNNNNNYLINNSNMIPRKFLYDNNHINNNIFYSSNNLNFINFKYWNNESLSKTFLNNENTAFSYIFNNINNIPINKQIFDEYIIMFGRLGWICDLCNNFNYVHRRKFNRCHMMKIPKKIYYQKRTNNNLRYKRY